MRGDTLGLVRRALAKPPRYVAQRIVHEIGARVERHVAPIRHRWQDPTQLARAAGHSTVASWWKELGGRPYLLEPASIARGLDDVCPSERARVASAAEEAKAHEVVLLGSGKVALGAKIDWHKDYKSGDSWPQAYFRDITYGDPNRASDVKFPWELSRMQWMLPLAQGYLLTGREAYAVEARSLLHDWISENPTGRSVNWACPMEVALRILSWTCLYHLLKDSVAWSDAAFQGEFLRSLYLHGDFLSRNLERSDINGNHYTANAAGLVFGGLFFGDKGPPARWSRDGWRILTDELPRQVTEDGVDFEASVPYHRLVAELFLLPALYRRSIGASVPESYVERMASMARFTAAYSRDDGTVPLWGDADDARALPLGGQGLNDHRYIVGLVAEAFAIEDLRSSFSGSRSEVAWLLGPQRAGRLPDRAARGDGSSSTAFVQGGFLVLRSATDHIFVDCGPVGLAGRGGHGHNDVLSFEAVIDNAHLVTDCGAFVYTADYRERNLFRSTGYHNTPQIDHEEVNRLVRWDYIWSLRNDAVPDVRETRFQEHWDRIAISHGGYRRLPSPVTPVRTIQLDHKSHRLTVTDEFDGEGSHHVRIPLHLAAGVEVCDVRDQVVHLRAERREFRLEWASRGDWNLTVHAGRVSPSYGVTRPIRVLVWERAGTLLGLTVSIAPESGGEGVQ